VQGLVLRMLSQARYADQNLGHYGLASTAYLHFTSPIRRYPDLLVHRALRALWLRERPLTGLDALADHCSRQERKAVDAERAVTALMQCQIAQQHIGEVMHATITGVHGAGAFVRPRELFVDGLIPMEALSSRFRAFYRYDEENQMLVAPRSGHMLRLGDKLKVQLASVNMRKRFIDFVPENVEQTMNELRGVRQGERRGVREELRQKVREERGRPERGRNTRRSAGGKPGGGKGRGKPHRRGR
jgi:ribonuclease R